MSQPLGIFLMAMGGPHSMEDIEPYLLDVRHGRPVSPEFLREIKDRYRLIGGKSPLLELTRRQAGALEKELQSRGLECRAYVGMRHWHPYIEETLQKAVGEGVSSLAVLCMAPQYSRRSIGAYREKLEQAVQKLKPDLQVRYAPPWHTHPLFIRAIAENVKKILEKFPAEERDSCFLLFTAHSLPEKILEEGDPYVRQLEETAQALAQVLKPAHWRLVFQSQSPTGEKWLGPEAGQVLEELAKEGRRAVVMVPIGFVADHLEILYDIDVLYREKARSLGMRFERIPSLNDHPLFIQALASAVLDCLNPDRSLPLPNR